MSGDAESHLVYYALPILGLQSCLVCVMLSLPLRSQQALLSLLGLVWCATALHVEAKLRSAYPSFDYERPPADMSEYTPFCDFAPWAKCSRVIMSPYGHILSYTGLVPAQSAMDLPNPVLGGIFYACHLFYPLLRATRLPLMPYLGFVATVVVSIFTAWIAFTLFAILRDFCIVCVSMYAVNFLLVPVMGAVMSQHHRGVPETLSCEIGASIRLLWLLLMLVNGLLHVVVVQPYNLLSRATALLRSWTAVAEPSTKKPEVVIVGASFGGLACERHLSGRADINMTLVDLKDFFEYTPGILRCFVEPAYLSELTCSLACRPSARTSVVCAELCSVADDHVVVRDNAIGDGPHATRKIPFDYLVLATGSTYAAPVKPRAAEPTLVQRRETWEAAHHHLTVASTVIIVGAGAVGVELAGEILTAFPDKHVTFVDRNSAVLPGFERSSADHALRWLKKRNVTFRLGTAFQAVHAAGVTLQNGEELTADAVYLCVGVFPNTAFLAETPLKSHFGFRNALLVNEHLQLDGKSNVYAIGDAMMHSSKELKLGHTAELNGALAAHNIERQVEAAAARKGDAKPLLTYPEGVVHNSVSPKIYCVSLGAYDATLGFNGLVINGFVAALMKWMLEWTKVAAARQYPIGILFWEIADVASCFLGRTILPTPAAWPARTSSS